MLNENLLHGRTGLLTMNVATLAISGPHVSAMISRVRAWVLISIPLLTKISRGTFPPSRVGFRAVSVSLSRKAIVNEMFPPHLRRPTPIGSPDTLSGYGKEEDIHFLHQLR